MSRKKDYSDKNIVEDDEITKEAEEYAQKVLELEDSIRMMKAKQDERKANKQSFSVWLMDPKNTSIWKDLFFAALLTIPSLILFLSDHPVVKFFGALFCITGWLGLVITAIQGRKNFKAYVGVIPEFYMITGVMLAVMIVFMLHYKHPGMAVTYGFLGYYILNNVVSTYNSKDTTTEDMEMP
jgi:hypothetical protein